MSESATKGEIEAAEAYEGLHVPALFRQWASRILEQAAVGEGHRLLDVACGTGIVAREAHEQFGDGLSAVGIDASAGMLTVARRIAPAIKWVHGVADALPFDDRDFDVVVCQFGFMFFPDRYAAIREMLRVLEPGGRFAIAVWDALERSEAYPETVELLARRAGPEAAAALSAPFALGDPSVLVAELKDAGAGSVEVTTLHGRARFPGIRTMVEADLRGWLPVMGVTLSENQIDTILAEAEHVLQKYVMAAGQIEFDSPAHIVTGEALE